MNPGNCVFSLMLYIVSRIKDRSCCFESSRNMLSTSFLDEKAFTLASLVNLQNDRIYMTSNAKLRDIAAERLLRCRSTFSSLLMVSVAVSKLRCTELFFVEPAVKVDGKYWDDECQRYSKQSSIVSLHWSYSVQHQCRFFETQSNFVVM